MATTLAPNLDHAHDPWGTEVQAEDHEQEQEQEEDHEHDQEQEILELLGGGLEPPCLSAYAPQTYVSAISPPERVE